MGLDGCLPAGGRRAKGTPAVRRGRGSWRSTVRGAIRRRGGSVGRAPTVTDEPAGRRRPSLLRRLGDRRDRAGARRRTGDGAGAPEPWPPTLARVARGRRFMTKNLEERFEALDTLRASELRGEVDRRLGAGIEHAIPGPGGRGRLTAAVLALAVFAAAAAFSWSIYERNRGTLPTAPADPWSWVGEGWTELPAPPKWRDGASIL